MFRCGGICLIIYNSEAIIVPHRMKLVHCPLIGGLLHLIQRRGDWAGAYHSPYCCIMVCCSSSGFNVTIYMVKAGVHYSSQLQTWFSTRFAARFSTSSWRFATRFRPAFDFFLSKTWSRTAAGSLVRARARQMECRKKPVLSKFAAGFRHAFDHVFDQVCDQVYSWLE